MIKLNIVPDRADLMAAWTVLNPAICRYWPEAFLDSWHWLHWWETEASCLWHPIVISDWGRPVCIIGITNYSSTWRCAELHYCAQFHKQNRLCLLAAKDVVDQFMGTDEIDLLYGHHEHNNLIARTAGLFGFERIHKTQKLDYRVRTS